MRHVAAGMASVRRAMGESSRSTWQRVQHTAAWLTPWSRAAPRRLGRHLVHSAQYYRQRPAALRQELLSALTIAVLQIPESIAFSFIAGVDPIVGLRATVVLGFVCGLLSVSLQSNTKRGNLYVGARL